MESRAPRLFILITINNFPLHFVHDFIEKQMEKYSIVDINRAERANIPEIIKPDKNLYYYANQIINS